MEPDQRRCRKCGTPLAVGVNCTEGRIAHHDYICQACYRDAQRPYQREWAREKRGGLRGPKPPYMTAGEKHGRWLVLADARTSEDRVPCRCDCGTEAAPDAGSIKRGLSRSCGCLRAEVTTTRAITHGLSGHPLYGTWHNMVARCTRPTAAQYEDYGGRTPPITVCDRWLGLPDGLLNFVADMGPKPSPQHSLNRAACNHAGRCGERHGRGQ
jgi:hypothetical protein